MMWNCRLGRMMARTISHSFAPSTRAALNWFSGMDLMALEKMTVP